MFIADRKLIMGLTVLLLIDGRLDNFFYPSQLLYRDLNYTNIYCHIFWSLNKESDVFNSLQTVGQMNEMLEICQGFKFFKNHFEKLFQPPFLHSISAWKTFLDIKYFLL